MARILEIRELCERALRKIGSYSINDSGARPREMEEARFWLDMVVAAVAARRRIWWLVPATAPIQLTAGQASYNLTAVLPHGAPVSHVVAVYLVNLEDGSREQVDNVRRSEWEARAAEITSGPPQMVHIDRLPDPTLQVWPTPTAPLTHRLDVVVQRCSPDLTQGASTEKLLGFREAWNLYLVTALAAQLANGPVRKAPADEVRDMQLEAARLLSDLEAYDAHEQANEPRRVAYNDF
ncbi:phage adaptor protein [Falsiroseomonas tokyonensis]|uniref:Uncharacterized protein n=1 Tax=Falsiroseomonas tokyonensis TaxID=430521 RepID=A0ABV7BZX3_9PROT|nr:hypothetical protein [Falsiroseomonas tokyonensis]MBU8540182.1 hypothetical protein [Falsiroseomonas tokyonensis]